jgi:hypothetical protein
VVVQDLGLFIVILIGIWVSNMAALLVTTFYSCLTVASSEAGLAVVFAEDPTGMQRDA